MVPKEYQKGIKRIPKLIQQATKMYPKMRTEKKEPRKDEHLRFLAPLCRFVVPFSRPQDFEGLPKSLTFMQNQNQITKNMPKKAHWENMIC